jgi:hypothetical protein
LPERALINSRASRFSHAPERRAVACTSATSRDAETRRGVPLAWVWTRTRPKLSAPPAQSAQLVGLTGAIRSASRSHSVQYAVEVPRARLRQVDDPGAGDIRLGLGRERVEQRDRRLAER